MACLREGHILIYASWLRLLQTEQVNMPKQPMSADNLFLLGELLQGAGEYVARCRQSAPDEDRFMVELAREQIPHLKLALRTLDHSLTDLDGHLKDKLGIESKAPDGEKKPDRRYRKATSGK
jgi:hypothetical protein